MSKVKEIVPVDKGLKEKVKAAPKELLRCGLSDGTQRLRGQLRDTSQRGQRDGYGGDQIEDTAWAGGHWAKRGIQRLLKQKKDGRAKETDHSPSRSPESPAELPSWDSPALPDLPEMPAPQGRGNRMRIKTREAVALAGQVETSESASPRFRTQSSMFQSRSASPFQATDVPVMKNDPVRIRIRTRESTLDCHSGAVSSDKSEVDVPSQNSHGIKIKDSHIHQESPAVMEQKPQASQTLDQGRKLFQQKQTRKLAENRKGQQASAENPSIPQVGPDKSFVQHPSFGCRSVHNEDTSGFPTPRAKNSTGKEFVPGGKRAINTVRPDKAVRSGSKAAERAAGRSVKTAERTSKQMIKSADRGTKVVEQTAKAIPHAHIRAVQAVRATKKATATTTRGVAKASKAALRATVRAARMLAAALAAGGSVVTAVVLVICLVGLIIASPFGIFFADGSSDLNAVSPAAAVAQINREYTDTLSSLQAGGSYDSVEIIGGPPSWVDVFAVFSVKTTAGDSLNIAVLDTDRVDRLRAVFWDMTKITTATSTVEHPATDEAEAWTETTLTITVTPRTPEDMRVLYLFTSQQDLALDELLSGDNRTLWSSFLYGSNGEIVAVALSQVGNVGGQPYWSWYGFNSRVEWCACFVSWCANECGYIDAGVIPKFAGCTNGSNWFKNRDLWQEKDYEPHPGDVIFFDWACFVP